MGEGVQQGEGGGQERGVGLGGGLVKAAEMTGPFKLLFNQAETCRNRQQLSCSQQPPLLPN